MKKLKFHQIVSDFQAKRNLRMTPQAWAKSKDYVRKNCLELVIERTQLSDFDPIDKELSAYIGMCKKFEKDFDLRTSLVATTQAILENNRVIIYPEINERTNEMLDKFDKMNDDSWSRL